MLDVYNHLDLSLQVQLGSLYNDPVRTNHLSSKSLVTFPDGCKGKWIHYEFRLKGREERRMGSPKDIRTTRKTETQRPREFYPVTRGLGCRFHTIGTFPSYSEVTRHVRWGYGRVVLKPCTHASYGVTRKERRPFCVSCVR